MPATRRQPAAPTIRLRVDAYERECRRAGLETEREQAEALNVTRQTINNLRNRRTDPSRAFIAHAMVAFGVPFEHLFAVELVETAA